MFQLRAVALVQNSDVGYQNFSIRIRCESDDDQDNKFELVSVDFLLSTISAIIHEACSITRIWLREENSIKRREENSNISDSILTTNME